MLQGVAGRAAGSTGTCRLRDTTAHCASTPLWHDRSPCATPPPPPPPSPAGTHVAGTAIGLQVGVAKEAQVVSVRILDCTGSGTISDTVAGLGERGQGGRGRGARAKRWHAVAAMLVPTSPPLPCPTPRHPPLPPAADWVAANHKKPAVVTLSLGIQVRRPVGRAADCVQQPARGRPMGRRAPCPPCLMPRAARPAPAATLHPAHRSAPGRVC